MIENEKFFEFLRQLLKDHSQQPIVFELLKSCQSKEEISKILEETRDFIDQTFTLDLYLRLYPDRLQIGKELYESILHRINKDSITDEWLIIFNRCTKNLHQRIEIDFDFKDLFNNLIEIFSIQSLNLLNSLLNEKTYRVKHFARFLKHPKLVDIVASNDRSIIVDLLSKFVSFNRTDDQIDCSKHIPMLLSIYSPTLSENNQHILACMHQYEKCGVSLMKSTFIWGQIENNQERQFETISKLLDEKLMKKSIQFFPVTRRLRVSRDFERKKRENDWIELADLLEWRKLETLIYIQIF